ncbi:ATP-binding protein [Ruegeria marisrubri]|uniref:ATP-dependent nuclease n=1 Tax=Ruegeria marisrubri TaxID=1685379 RepID=UPI001CD428BC|nr:AAA family ATPase [Ruegeria marisrubri]MCA0906264.1 ATP-binding protein [Ruegeria marisrubri]
MFFKVISSRESTPSGLKNRVLLREDNWDDWFKFNTMYSLSYFDREGNENLIGSVKIGQFGMQSDQRRADIPTDFDFLDERFFSLGQDDSYYIDLNEQGEEVRDRVLDGLNDVARNEDIFTRSLDEKVTGTSLLRGPSVATVRGQFRRIANGGARLTDYHFSYTAPRRRGSKSEPVHLDFSIEPESLPPTNIHVLIGRNGVGKTYLLNNMVQCLLSEDEDIRFGTFDNTEDDILGEQEFFARLVSVSFSAFDTFEPLPIRQDKSKGLQFTYIGLRNQSKDGEERPPKSPDNLATDFANSVLTCRQGTRLSRWRRALELLEADPIFKAAEISDLASDDLPTDDIKKDARSRYGKLSSGHKIVLLTITRLVETVEEKTLVLLDEPEAHLHPPLLSAFVRALSDLLINRNGVALIATHSPVVLQEVPKGCVWMIRRVGSVVNGERPSIETFGENVGVLTREVFGLEVAETGFHRMLREAVEEEYDYEDVVDRFSGALGGEARALVRALFSTKDEG